MKVEMISPHQVPEERPRGWLVPGSAVRMLVFVADDCGNGAVQMRLQADVIGVQHQGIAADVGNNQISESRVGSRLRVCGVPRAWKISCSLEGDQGARTVPELMRGDAHPMD